MKGTNSKQKCDEIQLNIAEKLEERNMTKQNRTSRHIQKEEARYHIIPSAPGGQMPCTGQPVKHKIEQ